MLINKLLFIFQVINDLNKYIEVFLPELTMQDCAQQTLFIFDEPTTGLHFHDIKKLLDAFNALIAQGHSLVIIEHNMDVIKLADYIIDIGPEGGKAGGEIVAKGTPEEIIKNKKSYTAEFLKKELL